MISTSLLEAIINYLATKPYREVHSFIHAAQQEVAQYQAAQEKEIDAPVTTKTEKGE
jgi:hypothetical protein|tara:strand:+ start:886 stop:1056 length:171 start_codon:yes stop_codon:yes gene_type:complete